MSNFNDFTFRQIEADTDIKPFDCGDPDLNGFLFDDAKKYLNEMLAVTYLLEDSQAQKTVAYYCLLNDKIELNPGEKSKWNKLNRNIPNNKRHHAYPAVKIGRLGVSKRICTSEYRPDGIAPNQDDFLAHEFEWLSLYNSGRLFSSRSIL